MTNIDIIERILCNSDHNVMKDFLIQLGDDSFSKGYEILINHLDDVEYNDKIYELMNIFFNDDYEQANLILDEIRLKIKENSPNGKELRQAERKYQHYLATRPDFEPYVWVENERSVPSQITFFILCGGISEFKRIMLPWEIVDKPIEEQYEMIKEIILTKGKDEKYRRYMGEVICFIYRPSDQRNLYFDTDGNFLREEIKDFNEPAESLEIL